MALITFKPRCKDCEATRDVVKELRETVEAYRKEVADSLLDYENLYDKVRTNLAKLAKRESVQESPENGDQPQQRGTLALQRVLALRGR